MIDNTFDHGAEAKRLLDGLRRQPLSLNEQIGMATTRALLEIAEQQKTANLLELWMMHDNPSYTVRDVASQRLGVELPPETDEVEQ